MDKDRYLSTPDEHFNTNAQYWYFQFTGIKKPETNKPFDVFIQALFDIYFFIRENPNKPFACIEKIKDISTLHDFNEAEKLILIDKLLGILYHYPYPGELVKVYIQVVDYRNDLSPWNEDPEIKNFKFRFDIEDIKSQLLNIEAPNEKYKFLRGLMFDFQASVNDLDELDLLYYKEIGLLHFLETEAERAKFNELHHPALAPGTTNTIVPQPETTEQKIKRILEPLRVAFDTPGHIDKIGKALVDYSDNGDLPPKSEKKVIQVSNHVFYPPFKQLKNETSLTVPGIAQVLTYFIYPNNGSFEPLAPRTIEKNIKQNYRTVP